MQNEQLTTILINMTIGLAIVAIALQLLIMLIRVLSGTAAKLDLTDPISGERYRDVVNEHGRLLENANDSKGCEQDERRKCA